MAKRTLNERRTNLRMQDLRDIRGGRFYCNLCERTIRAKSIKDVIEHINKHFEKGDKVVKVLNEVFGLNIVQIPVREKIARVAIKTPKLRRAVWMSLELMRLGVIKCPEYKKLLEAQREYIE